MAPRKKTEAAVKGQETAAALTVQEKEEKTVEKKTVEKKAAEKKAPAKRTAAKTVKTALYVQYEGKEVSEKDLIAAAKKAYTKLGNKASDIKSLDIYVKPEEGVAYYVVNGTGSDDYKIEL